MGVSRTTGGFLTAIIPPLMPQNSVGDMVQRVAGRTIEKEISVVLPVGAQVVNVFQVTGVAIILNQWARITEVTTLNGCTGVYSTFYDGTVTQDLTANGIVLSNMPVNSYFVKDQVLANVYSLLDASQAQVHETIADRKSGRPFTCVQKTGDVDSFIQLRATAVGVQQAFKMLLHFDFELLGPDSDVEILL